ncbi:MAG: dihydropteroate synthase [Oscillospiraceae bacterium]|jgi:5-methyltetrahydrofolate--homocysteine methyltransferase|nr:dihydropteroate synthase [Oscillospiraceae bacterium]
MIIIGEKLNSSIPSVREAMASWNEAKLIELAQAQAKAGAAFLDVNAGMFGEEEAEKLSQLVKLIAANTTLPLCIDSPGYEAMAQALKVYQGPKPLINSTTLEAERFEKMSALAKKYNAGILALCMDDNGIPQTAEERIGLSRTLIEKLSGKGLALEDIYIDPMLSPLGVEEDAGLSSLEVIRTIRTEYPKVHITCGLSNISYGLPARKYINRAFLVAAIIAGMDSAILNPLDKELMCLVLATEALIGRDEYCENYIDLYREGYFD